MRQQCWVRNLKCLKTSFSSLFLARSATRPTCGMPVATKIGCILRNRNDVSHSSRNCLVATGAHVVLACFIWLNTSRLNWSVQFAVPQASGHVQPKNAHATRALATERAAITNQISVLRAMRLRVGLNPMKSSMTATATIAMLRE